MTLGEKIKQARTSQRLTQAVLAGKEITRNMLSAIESDKATPSLSTLKYLARELDVPIAYLLSEENDLQFFLKKERMPAIKKALEAKNYNVCVSLITKLDALDDELYYILALCFFELGIGSTKNGFLLTGKRDLELCLDYCNKTLYDTSKFEAIAPLYLAVCNNVNSPLLEFNPDNFEKSIYSSFEFEFFKYLTLDLEHEFKIEHFANHMAAKKLIRERKYSEALIILSSIEDNLEDVEKNAYFKFSLYGDLELCYKQLFDFQNAYRFSSKRLSLIEGFNT